MKKYKGLIIITFLIFSIMLQPAIPGFNLLPLNTSQTAYAADSQSPIILHANGKSYVLNIGQEYYMDNVVGGLYEDHGYIAKIEFSDNVRDIFTIRDDFSRRYITAHRSATEKGSNMLNLAVRLPAHTMKLYAARNAKRSYPESILK